MTTQEREQLKQIISTFDAMLHEYRKLTTDLIESIDRLKAENKALKAGKTDSFLFGQCNHNIN